MLSFTHIIQYIYRILIIQILLDKMLYTNTTLSILFTILQG